MTELLNAALGYAAIGWPVFPCNRDKRPLTENGVLDATTDPKQITEWWTDNPSANIGFSPGDVGLAVLDYDPGSDVGATRRALTLSATGLSQRTPRGGSHDFYELADKEIVAPSSSKIGKKVDVRSFHSYVLLAPSRTDDGAYTWASRGKPAYRSDEFVRVANSAKERSDDANTWIIEPDLPEHIDRAVSWLKHDAKISVQGQGGEANAYATAAYLKSLGISEERAWELMVEHWNARCDPPWNEDELDHLRLKVENGYKYNTSPPGNCTDLYHQTKRALPFQPQPVNATTLAKGREYTAGRFRIVDWDGMESIPDPSYLIKDTILKDTDAWMWGAPGTFKSFEALNMGLTVASGGNWPWKGQWTAVEQGPVLYCVGEGRSGTRLRSRAWAQHYLGGARVPEFFLMDPVPSITEGLEDFLTAATTMTSQFALVIVDTFGRAMYGGDENAAKDVAVYTDMMAIIRRELKCASLTIHHSGHDDKHERGSIAIRGNADTSIQVTRTEGEMKCTLAMKKQKDGEIWQGTRVTVMKEVKIGEAKSLVSCMPERHEDKPAVVERKQAEVKDAIAFDVLDKAVVAVLRANPSRIWTQRELAETVAMRPEIDTGSDVLRNTLLKQLREKKGTKAGRCFDPSLPSRNGQWKFRD